jgi:hypothetical protein
VPWVSLPTLHFAIEHKKPLSARPVAFPEQQEKKQLDEQRFNRTR